MYIAGYCGFVSTWVSGILACVPAEPFVAGCTPPDDDEASGGVFLALLKQTAEESKSRGIQVSDDHLLSHSQKIE